MFNIKIKNSGALRAPWSIGNTKDNAPKSSANKRRTYRFTLNNYKESDPEHLEQTFLNMGAKKFAFQEEIGEKNKTPHLQGCVFFKNEIYFNTMKKINNRINWLPLKYPKRAISYCLKTKTRKPGGLQWYHGININDYVEKPVVPLMDHKEMCEDMCKQMIEEISDMKWPKDFHFNMIG